MRKCEQRCTEEGKKEKLTTDGSIGSCLIASRPFEILTGGSNFGGGICPPEANEAMVIAIDLSSASAGRRDIESCFYIYMRHSLTYSSIHPQYAYRVSMINLRHDITVRHHTHYRCFISHTFFTIKACFVSTVWMTKKNKGTKLIKI